MEVAAVLAALLLLVAATLAIPVELSARLERVHVTQGHFEVRWLFGRVTQQMRLGRRPSRAALTRPRPTQLARRALAALRTPGFGRRCLRLLSTLRGRIEIHELELEARVGFEDPADTGLMFGALEPVWVLLGTRSQWRVRVEPDFEEERLEARARASLRTVPARLLVDFVRFALAPETLRAAWAALRVGAR